MTEQTTLSEILAHLDFAAAAATDNEIERRFLVAPDFLGDLATQATGFRAIRQGYIPSGQGTFRARQSTSLCTPEPVTGYALTCKNRISPLWRQERWLAVNQETFAQLWPLTKGRRLHKIRADICLDDGYIAELDIFKNGLLIAEVEGNTEEAVQSVRLPDWIGPEITGLKGWASAHLARWPLSAPELALAGLLATHRMAVPPRLKPQRRKPRSQIIPAPLPLASTPKLR